MAKFLFVVPPFIGHINPTLGIGGELLSRGHEVIWIGIKEIPKSFIPKGGKFIVPHQYLEDNKDIIDEILEKQDNGPSIYGADILKFAMEETYIPFSNFLMNPILEIIDEYKPDLIINDETMFCGAIAAVIKNIPYATSIAVPPGLFQPVGIMPKVEQWQTNLVLELQKKYGITGENKITNSSILNLSYTSKEFIVRNDFPDHYKFVGPIVKGRPVVGDLKWEKLLESDKPKVYISIGTLLKKSRKTFFSKIVEAIANLDIVVIVATDSDVLEEWPDNFIVESFVPQSELLTLVDVVIYHGGFNTVNESLLNGVPMILLPMAYDQFYIASLVVYSGSGIRLKFKRSKALDIRNALLEVINNTEYKNAALKIGARLKEGGGTNKATNYLEELVVEHEVNLNTHG